MSTLNFPTIYKKSQSRRETVGSQLDTKVTKFHTRLLLSSLLSLLRSTTTSTMASTHENQDLFRLFRYTPNLGAAALFTILFMILAIIHTYQVLVTRTWFFTAFVVGSFCTPNSVHDERCLKLAKRVEQLKRSAFWSFVSPYIHHKSHKRQLSPHPAVHLRRRKPQLDDRFIFRSHHFGPRGTISLCSEHIHDTRPHNPSHGRRDACSGQTALAY